MRVKNIGYTKLMIIDGLSPEDEAMLQALYSRSAESAEIHMEKLVKSGSGKFMSTFYVGYGHKSIADCGTTTMFLENVSLLAAKAVQDTPMYSGQETSTRYIDMSKQHIVDPVGTAESKAILDAWMNFYTSYQEEVAVTVRERHPAKPDENLDVYEKAVKARVFDILRGFLPAGITTQLSWHTNLRQAGDHLNMLTRHPSEEIRDVSNILRLMLSEQYPSSGLGLSLPTVSGVRKDDGSNERAKWEGIVANRYTYKKPAVAIATGDGVVMATPMGMADRLVEYGHALLTRPRGCVLPHFLSDLGQCSFEFLLDFGSFRDIQRHRNGVCRMPLLTTEWGFEDWYLDQLSNKLQVEASFLIHDQGEKIQKLTDNKVVRQYYTALGYRVPTSVTYGLPATVYVLELRSGKTIHPTLRRKIHKMIDAFRDQFPGVTLHVDMDADDWTVRRGTQTITEKERV